DLLNDAVAAAQNDLRRIPEAVAVDMRRRDELTIAQIDEPADQQHRSPEIGRAIVDPGNEMGVDVAGDTFKAGCRPGLLIKKREQMVGLMFRSVLLPRAASPKPQRQCCF